MRRFIHAAILGDSEQPPLEAPASESADAGTKKASKNGTIKAKMPDLAHFVPLVEQSRVAILLLLIFHGVLGQISRKTCLSSSFFYQKNWKIKGFEPPKRPISNFLTLAGLATHLAFRKLCISLFGCGR
jgi:hypothetical protein